MGEDEGRGDIHEEVLSHRHQDKNDKDDHNDLGFE